MKKLLFTLLTAGLFSGNNAFAQFVIMDGPAFNAATGVSDEGKVSGYYGYRDPYQIWYPELNRIDEIGGVGPGLNVGGQALFSADDKYLCGSSNEKVSLSQEWQKKSLDQKYYFTEIAATSEAFFAAGKSAIGGGDGVVLKCSNMGKRWIEMFAVFNRAYEKPTQGVETLSFPSFDMGYVGGYGFIAKTTSYGLSWDEVTPVSNDVVCYQTIDFADNQNGVAGVILNEGYGVYVTKNEGRSWSKASGVSGVPLNITHVDLNTYFMLTSSGVVQKSTDGGKTWTDLYVIEEAPRKIKFYNSQIGILTAEGAVYRTTDGGITWSSIEVRKEITANTKWNDVVWIDQQNLVLVGSNDVIYVSSDGGVTWSWDNMDFSDGRTELFAVSVNDQAIHICGDNSTFYRKSRVTHQDIIQMSRYDVEQKEWIPLGYLGGYSDDVASGGFNISGDGKTVVGNSYASFNEKLMYTLYEFSDYCHAVAWTEEEGFIDLGSLLADQSQNARANAISHDGRVVVGYQDRGQGLWVSAVWRKNPAGGYFPNEYILLDPAAGMGSESNFMGECTAVSANGQWIGGISDYYHGEAWIWSEETGVISLGGGNQVYYINDEGTLAIGQTFVWTKESGIKSIHSYLSNEKQMNLGSVSTLFVQSVSPNGQYLAGFGIEGGNTFTYRADLGVQDGITEKEIFSEVSVYPNPVSDVLNIKLPVEKGRMMLFNSQGQVVKNREITSLETVVSLVDLNEGLYFLNIKMKDAEKTYKINVAH